MQGYYNGYSACSVSSPPAQQSSGPGVAQVKATPKIDSVLGGYLPNGQIGVYTTPKYDRNEITSKSYPNFSAPKT
jgi:hypothetical protein